MRLAWAAVLIAAVPAFAAGQSSRPAGSDGPALPSIGLPLPAIGLPLPSIGLSPASEPSKPSQSTHRQNPPRRRGGGKGRHARPAIVFVGPGYGWDYSAPTPAPDDAPALQDSAVPAQEPAPPTGTLQIDVRPSDGVQLYVDGYFVGTLDEANGQLVLEVGPHSIEMRAPGYETIRLNVKLEAGRTITYRGALVRLDATPAPDPPAPVDEIKPLPPQPVYFIPGCYLGNVPPKDAKLPATCDLSRVKVLEP